MRERESHLPDPPDRWPFAAVTLPKDDGRVIWFRIPSAAQVGRLSRVGGPGVMMQVAAVFEAQAAEDSKKRARATLASLVGLEGFTGLVGLLLAECWADPVLELEHGLTPKQVRALEVEELRQLGADVHDELHNAGLPMMVQLEIALRLVGDALADLRVTGEVAERVAFFARTVPTLTESAVPKSSTSADD